jgi:hypothetical protein
LPSLPSQRGIGSAHLFESAAPAPMTAEQRIRGVDATVDWAILVTGYDEASIAALASGTLDTAALAARRARPVASGVYRQVYALSDRG